MSILYKLWNSPTFTQYGKFFVTLASALFLLPIVLITFNTVEISIWLLLSTSTMLASILSQRIQMTFIRVISFAFAGANNYDPIVNHGEKRGNTVPNWIGIQDIYFTLGKTFIFVSVFTSFVIVVVLSFGINNMVTNLTNEYITIILIVGISTLFTQNYLKYNIFIMGFNEVALINRWNILFGIVSILGSIIILSVKGNLLELIIWQMIIPMISSLRDKWLFCYYLKQKNVEFNGKFDIKILKAVKDPLWKSIVVHISQMGMIQVSGIIITINGDPGIVATYLFTIRIFTLIAELSQVPINSIQPYFSRLRAEGNLVILSNIYIKRIFLTMLVFSLGIIFLYLFGNYILEIIKSNVVLPSNNILLIMGLLYGIERLNILYFGILASANQIIMYIENIFSSVITLFCFLIFKDLDILTVVTILWIPRILIYHIKPLKIAASSLQITTKHLLIYTFSPMILILIALIIDIYTKGTY
ncbi:hypothetical protein A7H1H_0667 [Aliarcobacter butzleri 7h1h]|uniref:hypothetical protein n=1 Tax=Aliarcobacter butzleri TaxID=28197 RepID=UPI0002E8164D|nr:hypothetical protein [Aliarcobacter butzleri]AGR76979.1 hypothetical protein A7H1H_0667 [Aliarcobacter butzleri 7h1h]